MHVLQTDLWLFAETLNIVFGLEVWAGIVPIDFFVLIELTEAAFAGLNVELIFGVLGWRDKGNSSLQGADMADSIFAFVDTLA